METIRVRWAAARLPCGTLREWRSRIGKDGVLQIQLPHATEGTELDMIIVYQQAAPTKDTTKLSDRFYGCIQDDTFVRYPQPEQPEREAFQLFTY